MGVQLGTVNKGPHWGPGPCGNPTAQGGRFLKSQGFPVRFITELSLLVIRRIFGGVDHFYLKFLVKLTPLEQRHRHLIDIRS